MSPSACVKFQAVATLCRTAVALESFVCFSEQSRNNRSALKSFMLHLAAPVHSPMTAVRYQTVILFILSVRLVLGSLIVTLLAFRTFLNLRDFLRADRLTGRKA